MGASDVKVPGLRRIELDHQQAEDLLQHTPKYGTRKTSKLGAEVFEHLVKTAKN